MTSQNIISVVKQYGGRLNAFIKSRVSSDEDAEDILQDVWYQLSRLVNLEEIESISGWLFRVTRNRIIDLYRKQRPDRLDDWEEDQEDDLSFTMPELPDDALFRELFWEELMNALEELPALQREAFVANELDGMSLQEIADRSGYNLKTVISRKRYAVMHLRKRLKDLYNDLINH